MSFSLIFIPNICFYENILYSVEKAEENGRTTEMSVYPKEIETFLTIKKPVDIITVETK